MVKEFKVKTSFKVKGKERDLYHKYGIPAIELANDGDFIPAIKLLDKILKEKPKCEFALFLKANYLLNHIQQNFEKCELPEVTPENLEVLKEIFKKYKKDIENSITLLDRVLKINPKNKNAKEFKEVIKKTTLKSADAGIKSINESIKKLKNANISNQVMYICPYCDEEFRVEGGLEEKEQEIECELCHKKFMSITGTIKVIRGRTNAVVSYGAEPISITLKMKNSTKTINFTTSFRFLVYKGDQISFIYKKGFLSSSYNTNPSLIYNWTAGDRFRV